MIAIDMGEYDDLATLVRERTDAVGVIVIVVEGNRGGNGFSVQVRDPLLLAFIPTLLRVIAERFERDYLESKG